MIGHDNLEEFSDPQRYDSQDDSDTGLAFYAALAQESGGPVLEIACGTGRISIPIARLGFAVTGLDIVAGMLERAAIKSSGLATRWVQGDGRTFDLGEQFRLIFLTGNAFQLFLTRADQEALLGCVHAHLHDEGLFAFETRNRRWPPAETHAQGLAQQAALEPQRQGAFFYLETREQEEEEQGYIDGSGREVRVSRTQRYDPVDQVLHLTGYRRWREGDQEQTQITRIALRYTLPKELEALLHDNGFTLVRQYGDWNLEPLTAASPSIIVVCRKRT